MAAAVLEHPFALYDAFTSRPFAGSQAGVVLNAGSIAAAERLRIAQEIGAPATAFVDSVRDGRVAVQFFSTVMELPMCGHGTLCLITCLVERGLLPEPGQEGAMALLDLPRGAARVSYRRNAEARVEVMLDVSQADFRPFEGSLAKLVERLGVGEDAVSCDVPVEIAVSDFVHLCLPMRDLEACRSLAPDFPGLAAFCRSIGVDTVAAVTTDVVHSDRDLHVRDFCPAVGVAESAAAGTTNAALSLFALRHGLVAPDGCGVVTVRAEQGLELGRPSSIKSRIEMRAGRVERLQVGGVASKLLDGSLQAPSPL